MYILETENFKVYEPDDFGEIKEFLVGMVGTGDDAVEAFEYHQECNLLIEIPASGWYAGCKTTVEIDVLLNYTSGLVTYSYLDELIVDESGRIKTDMYPDRDTETLVQFFRNHQKELDLQMFNYFDKNDAAYNTERYWELKQFK